MGVDKRVAGGPHHHHHGLGTTAVALLLATTAVPAYASNAGLSASSAGATSAAEQPQPTDPRETPIVITAPAFRGVVPERSFDEDMIASYGVSTIDELLGEVQSEAGGSSDDQPLILVNGKRIKDISEIGALPVEALRSVQVLPRGLAVAAGGKAGQRVISLTLKERVQSATLTAAHRLSTEGHWNSDRGEAIVTNVRGSTRINVALRVRDESRLLESDRGIIQPAPLVPYAIGGNLVGYPLTSGEIDPTLSALAGQIVTVVPLPADSHPTLADFIAQANTAQVTDIGHFRSLRPDSRTYDLNTSFATELAPWLNATATVHANQGNTRSLRGLPNALFVLSPSNPASPFSRQVGIAFSGQEPLIYDTRHDAGDVNLTFNAVWGSWSADLNLRHSESRDNSTTNRPAQSGAIFLPDGVNPFSADLSGIIPLRQDFARSYATSNLADVLVNGPLFNLPAGSAQATFEGKLSGDDLRSTSTYSSVDKTNLNRAEQSLRGAVVIPIASRANNAFGAIGDLSASAELSRIHYSDAGSVTNHSLGFTWDPRPIVHLEGDLEQTELAPPVSILGEPAVITPGSRVFDPLTGQTADVTIITGGNPHLLPETDKVRRVSGLLRLIPKINLQLNAEYNDTERRNFLSSLPDASAAVMLAFPDRFVRNSEGQLTTVDLRPVNFESSREKSLRWGLSMNAKLGGGGRGVPGRPARSQPSTLLQLTANHTMVFSSLITIRPGLDPVDVLGGGAIGISGGRVRHQADATASITSGGLGARLGLTYRGKSSLVTRLPGATDTVEFSPLFIANLRLFADAKRVFPNSKAARGFRLSLDILNVTDDRQKVRDSHGLTPLQYQPAYRDPLGRTIEIELRKVF